MSDKYRVLVPRWGGLPVFKTLLVTFLACLLVCSAGRVQAESLTGQQKGNPETDALVERARDQQVAGKMRAARKSFKKAVEQSSGRSVAASVGVVQTCLALGDIKGAADAGGALEELLSESGESRDVDLSGELAAAHMSVAMVRLQQVQVVDLRYEPSLAAVRGGLGLPGRWEKDRARALTSARSALTSALELQPQRASMIAPLLVDTLFALDDRTAACGIVERMSSGAGDGRIVGVPAGDYRRFQCLCTAHSSEELRLAHGDAFKPPRSIDRGVPPQMLEPSVNARSGTIVVDQVIDTHGRVACQLVRKSLGDAFDAIALASFRTWRFTPATVRGEPTVVFHKLVFHMTTH